MIQLSLDKSGLPRVEQWATPPIVYLDHWALRKISEVDELAGRFARDLCLRNGTLALSWLNLVEFGKVASAEQARKAERFIDSNLPRVFFMEVEPFTVIRKENAVLATGPAAPSAADVDFLKVFGQFGPASPDILTAHDLFVVMQRPTVAQGLDGLADKVVSRISLLRNEHATNPNLRSAVSRLPATQRVHRATRFLLPELVRTLLIDRGTQITRNHAIDLMHAVVPLAYCDMVLLDKHWETQVDRVRLRLNTACISAPVAEVFSGKANGIDRFLCELAGGTIRAS